VQPRHGVDRPRLDLPARPAGGADQLGAQSHEAIFVYSLVEGKPYIAALVLFADIRPGAILAKSKQVAVLCLGDESADRFDAAGVDVQW
jgi:hypothetical protein